MLSMIYKFCSNKFSYYISFLFVLISYFLVNITVYNISMYKELNGIHIEIFGGGDDGVFYWNQIQKILINDSKVIPNFYSQVLANIIQIVHFNDPIIPRLINVLFFLLFIILEIKLLKLTKNLF